MKFWTTDVYYLSKPFRVFNILYYYSTTTNTTSGTTKINQYYRSRMTVTQPNDRKFGENDGEYKKNLFLISAISEKKNDFYKMNCAKKIFMNAPKTYLVKKKSADELLLILLVLGLYDYY